MTKDARVTTVWQLTYGYTKPLENKPPVDRSLSILFASKQLAVSSIKKWLGADFDKLHEFIYSTGNHIEYREIVDDPRTTVVSLAKWQIVHTAMDLTVQEAA